MSSLHDRDQAAHDALAANIIYRAVIRSEPANHPEIGEHSVQISDGYVDNMMTLYCLRRPSGRPPDDTKYMSNMGWRNDIQYV